MPVPVPVPECEYETPPPMPALNTEACGEMVCLSVDSALALWAWRKKSIRWHQRDQVCHDASR